jgi:hypothetical protein
MISDVLTLPPVRPRFRALLLPASRQIFHTCCSNSHKNGLADFNNRSTHTRAINLENIERKDSPTRTPWKLVTLKLKNRAFKKNMKSGIFSITARTILRVILAHLTVNEPPD